MCVWMYIHKSNKSIEHNAATYIGSHEDVVQGPVSAELNVDLCKYFDGFFFFFEGFGVGLGLVVLFLF